MNGDGHFEKSEQEDAYLTLQVLWIAFGVCCFATIIGWLIWRMVVGGVYEWALGLLVLGVLLCIMLTGIRTAAIILLEGRLKKSHITPTPAKPRVVSTDRWMIVDPLERRGPL